MSEEATLSEKVYFEDKNIKVTNVRVTCRHLTVPLEKIGSVNINYKVEMFSLAVMCLILSLTPLLFWFIMPDKFKIPVAVISGILVLASVMLISIVYKSYTELILTVAGRAVKLLSITMGHKEYIEGVCAKIGDAMLDEKKYRELKASGRLDDAMRLNPSETLRLKQMLDEYDELKSMKEEFTERRKKAKKAKSK